MNKLLTLLGMLFIWGCGISQKLPKSPQISVDFKKQKLIINKRHIDGSSRLFDITKAMGRYDRTYEIGPYYAYFYDQWGILVLENKEQRTIEEVSFQYVLQSGRKATENTFQGKVRLAKKDLASMRSPQEVQQNFPKIDFQVLFDLLLRAQLERIRVAVIYTDEYDLELVTVNFAASGS